jgi:hypothetical protein
LSDVVVYMEGGGDTRDGKAALRIGMTAFLRTLKEMANIRRHNLKIVPCGGRTEARDAFLNAVKVASDDRSFLLVDSEEEVVHASKQHLKDRDGWNLNGISEREIHLMAQTMETWIVADVKTLTAYYGKNFLPNSLPKAVNLELVAKAKVADILRHATSKTQKGEYHKINHASALLQKIRPEEVRSRCSFCLRLFEILENEIAHM